MNINLNLNLPVCLSDGTKARLICSDRVYNEYPILALSADTSGLELLWAFRTDGTAEGGDLTLMNQFVYDGLAKGMKLNPNTGTQPDDFDRTREVITYDGLPEGDGTFWWHCGGGASDVVLYWPKPKTFTVELTAAEVVALEHIREAVRELEAR